MTISLISLSGVVIHGSANEIEYYKAMVLLDAPPVQLMRVDYPQTFLCKEDTLPCGPDITLIDIELRGVSVMVIIIEY